MTWGTYPVMNEEGLQCTSVGEVDEAVRGFWVDRILRQHAGRDEVDCWRRFEQSEFAAFVPQVTWTRLAWTGSRVKEVLGGISRGHGTRTTRGPDRSVEGATRGVDGCSGALVRSSGARGFLASGMV